MVNTMKTLCLLSLCLTALSCSAAPEGAHRVRHHRSGQRQRTVANEENRGRQESFLDLRTAISTPEELRYIKTEEIEADGFFNDMLKEKCRHHQCGSGRICRLNSRSQPFCECVAEDACSQSLSQVCGSDGVIYASHCHLHRIACIEGRRLRAEDNWAVCEEGKDAAETSPGEEEEEDEDEEEETTNSAEDGTALWVDETKESEPIDSKERASVKKDLGHPVLPKVLEPADFSSDVAIRCDRASFQDFKTRMLEYHCSRMGLRQCQDVVQDEDQKRFLANAMFVYYDKNNDDKLSTEELSYGQGTDHIEKIASTCRLTDLLVFRDSADVDASSSEMTKLEFDVAYGIDMEPAPAIAAEPVAASARFTDMKISPSSVVINEAMGIQLECLTGASGSQIVWERSGVDLSDAKIGSLQVLSDNSLYISPIDLHHTGNYSCYDRRTPLSVEVHVITAQVAPVVRARQMARRPMEGETVELQCRVAGIPKPVSAAWEVNGYRLPGNDPVRYGWANANTTLRILSVTGSRDTGVYACVAQTDVGRGQDAVEIAGTQDAATSADRTGSIDKVGRFMVFHEDGYTSYDPQLCVVTSSVDRYAQDFKVLPAGEDSPGILCPPAAPCLWGSSAKAGDQFVYVTQPGESRILVVDVESNSRPVQAITIDGKPTDVFYVKHLDEIWVLGGLEGSRTVFVVKDASRNTNHEVVRLLTDGYPFEEVASLFMPPFENDYGYTFQSAFAVRNAQMGLYRIDFSTSHQVHYVNLSKYECYPKNVEYLIVGGLAVIQCAPPAGMGERRGLLLLFDTVLGVVVPSSLGQGTVFATPNGRQLVVVNGADHVVVYSVADDGKVTLAYEEWLSINIGEVLFMPATLSVGYDMVAYSSDESIVFFMNLDTRKMEMLEGLATGRKGAPATRRVKNLVTASGPFGVYLILPSKGDVMVINKNWHNIQCQWSNLKSPQSVIWVDA